MEAKKANIKAALSQLSTFLEPYLPIVKTHMVHFYTEKVWDNLNATLQTDVMALTDIQLLELPNDYLNIKAVKPLHIGPGLLQLMEGISQHTLDSLKVLDNLSNVWQQMGIKPLSSLIDFDKFMNAKKSHEVSALCDVIASFANYTESKLVLDLGCGKGALASMLSLNHGLYVSGIDAVGFNVHAEEGRQSKLQKSFKSQVKKSRMCEDYEKTDLSLRFHRTTLYLSNNFDIRPLIGECNQHFDQSFRNVGLVGLHTCGNLASTSLQLFVNSPKARFLCNVGCCYHLLDELFDVTRDKSEPGFPLSNYLKSKRFGLGRNARMVSSQPLERYATHNKVTSYSRILQRVLRDQCVLA